MKGHFWYSEKQKEIAERFGNKAVTYAQINGKVVEYTQWFSSKQNQKPNWEDAVYLGEGQLVLAAEESVLESA